ncbi:MAG: HAMP domain-containing histidine kinase [Alphaproteobacteria bacterium]|nr:HAMP domain-containing histidine kinase [Alphaproteobacteria bacterium]MDE2111539.1 HAMP domain-containing histidine kinase [Alphaproteobacteria bacterium]MDE2494983.1 HAMP domain-containing histidine kinase [Alphaproteobacteria bacterium]
MRPHFNSILIRIVLLQIAAFAIAAAAVGIASHLLLNSASVRFENQSLRVHAISIAEHLKQQTDGSLRLDLPAEQRSYYDNSLGGLTYVVTDDDGHVLLNSPGSGIRVLKNDRSGKPTYFQSPNRRRSYLGLSIPVQAGSQQVWIQVTRNIRRPGLITNDVFLHFLRRVSWFSIPIVLFVFVTDFFVVRRVLHPVVVASQMAQTIDPRRLEVRLPTQNLPREVMPLVETINQGLARVEHGFNVQRDFTADAAHELRTPLSVLRMRLDGLEDRAAAKQLRADVDGMSHIVNQLLEVAELENVVVDGSETADLRRVCSDVVELVAPLALSQEKDIALTGSEKPVRVRGHAPMLFQAVRNLVENAVKYTAKGTTVEVNVGPQGIVRVLDEGPGVSEAERELIFRRFWRRDRAQTGGAGLGLAIVARVTEMHAGSVNIENRPAGGAVFSLDLSHALVG